jgi:hypothetical protein
MMNVDSSAPPSRIGPRPDPGRPGRIVAHAGYCGRRPLPADRSSARDHCAELSAPRVLPRTPAVARRNVSAVAPADPVTFLIAVALAALISTGVFVHASKHGSRHATAWGVAAFLAAGIAVPVYFIRYWLRRGGRDRSSS